MQNGLLGWPKGRDLKNTHETTVFDWVAPGIVSAASFFVPPWVSSLRVNISGRTTASGNSDNANVRFNGDTGNYSYQAAEAFGGTANASNGSPSSGPLGDLPGGTAVAGSWSCIEAVIFDLQSTTKSKTWVAQTYFSKSSRGDTILGRYGGIYDSRNPIKLIEFLTNNAWAAGSHIIAWGTPLSSPGQFG